MPIAEVWDFGKRVANDIIPVNIRQYLSWLSGSGGHLSAEDFASSDIDTIRGAVERKYRETGERRGEIGYYDYTADRAEQGVEQTGPLDMLWRSYTNPAFRAETTLGMARYEIGPNGEIRVSDKYDFAATPDQMRGYLAQHGMLGMVMLGIREAGPWGLANVLGNMAGMNQVAEPYVLHLGRLGQR